MAVISCVKNKDMEIPQQKRSSVHRFGPSLPVARTYPGIEKRIDRIDLTPTIHPSFLHQFYHLGYSGSARSRSVKHRPLTRPLRRLSIQNSHPIYIRDNRGFSPMLEGPQKIVLASSPQTQGSFTGGHYHICCPCLNRSSILTRDVRSN